MLVNLKEKPYYLNKEDIDWVNKTIESMTLEEKFKALFVCLTPGKDKDQLVSFIKELSPSGVRYNPLKSSDLYEHNLTLQTNSKVPLLICANTENGGNGACSDGTIVGSETKVAATRDISLAYKMGEISAKEAKACGVNTLFAPIVDIHNNFHNPVISNRTFGNDVDLVNEMSLAFFKGASKENVLCCAKHFPGDGYDERDQHLASSTNPLSVEKWDESFGKVYKTLINEGLPLIMAGHIKLPSYQKYFNKDLKEEDIRPATTSYELITKLLKEKLGFNGAVITDATHMVALTSSDKRENFIPNIIKAGCDLILFYNDPDEDLTFLKDAFNKGIVTKERLNDALRRVLGLKAKLGLHKLKNSQLMPSKEELKIINNEEYKLISNEVSKRAITLVKSKEANLIPLNKNKIKNILLVINEDENPFSMFMPKKKTIYEYIQEKLEKEGFNVTIFESLMDKAKKLPPLEAMKLISNVYGNKTPISDLTSQYDLIIQFADYMSHNTTQRIVWKLSKGTADIPFYVYELPVIFVSLNCPFHLFDVPQVKTYINCYDKNINTIDSLINKLLGKEEFMGVSPLDCFCGMIDTKY